MSETTTNTSTTISIAHQYQHVVKLLKMTDSEWDIYMDQLKKEKDEAERQAIIKAEQEK